MRLRSTFFLLIAVAVLGGFIFIVERKSQTTREREEQARRALEVDPARVSYLRFEAGPMLVECAREGDEWMLVQPVRTRASQAAIARILAGLENLPKGEVITEAERRARDLSLSDYGLDQPRATMTYGDSMHRRTILVGRDSLLGNQLYIKGQQQEEIIATSTNLLELIPSSVAAVRDRVLFRAGPERVQRLELTVPAGFLQVARQERGRWMIQQPVVTRAATPAVNALLESLGHLRVAEFMSDAGEDAVAYGFDEPAMRITVWYGERDGEVSLVLGHVLKSDPSLIYAKRRGEDFIYAVSTNVLTRLRVGLDDLRDKRLTALSPPEVARVEIADADRRLVLEQKDGAWHVAEPRQWKADEERVRELLAAWVAAPVLSFVDGIGTNLAAHGFLPPERNVVFSCGTTAGRDVETVHVRIGSRQKDSEQALVRIEGDDSLRGVDAAALNALSADPLFYRDREVLSVAADDVVFLTVQDGDRKQSVERDASGAFRPVGEEQFVLNDAAVKGMLMVLGELRAEEFVADDPDDVAPFGLTAPAAVLTVGLRSEAGISRSVLFGADAGDSGVYAMLKGRDQVFVLEKAVRSALLQNLYTVPPPVTRESLEADKR